MDLVNQPQERILQVCSSKKVKSAEKIIAARTNFEYRFDDKGNSINIWGYKPDGKLTSISVKI